MYRKFQKPYVPSMHEAREALGGELHEHKAMIDGNMHMHRHKMGSMLSTHFHNPFGHVKKHKRF